MFTFKPSSAGALSAGGYARHPGVRRDRVVVCCPQCEGEYQLARQYMITATGEINPRLHCPLFGCTWKQPAALADWGK